LLSQFLAHGIVRAIASLEIEILLIRVERIREGAGDEDDFSK
jgi:hypothetical protein